LQISGIGTLLTGINFVTTILKLRAPGMTYFRIPVFCWTALAANLLIIAAFPILTATFVMLLLDRHLGMHFFTNDAGGNQMMYVNLFWAWGHPEVYILILPAFGIFSEVVATFSGKALFSYRSMVWATLAICILSFMVWLHHFFTMGAGANVNAFFGIAVSGHRELYPCTAARGAGFEAAAVVPLSHGSFSTIDPHTKRSNRPDAKAMTLSSVACGRLNNNKTSDHWHPV
jgi:hypothetical protein